MKINIETNNLITGQKILVVDLYTDDNKVLRSVSEFMDNDYELLISLINTLVNACLSGYEKSLLTKEK